MSTTATSRRQTEANWIIQHPLVSAAIGFITLLVVALGIALAVRQSEKRQQAAISPAGFKADAERIAKNPWWSPGVTPDHVAHILSAMAANGNGTYVVSSDGLWATVSDPAQFDRLLMQTESPAARYTDSILARTRIGQAMDLCSNPSAVYGSTKHRFVVVNVYGSDPASPLDSATSRPDAGCDKFRNQLGMAWYYP